MQNANQLLLAQSTAIRPQSLVSKEWMVDMTEDVDESGWQYALKFHGAVWHGKLIWKRFEIDLNGLRHRHLANTHTPSADEEILVKTRTLVDVDEPSTSTTHRDENLFESLRQCRLDRERLLILEHVVSSTLPGHEEHLIAQAQKYIVLLDYESSKRKFIHRLLALKYANRRNNTALTFTVDERNALQSLRFYSDVQYVIDQLETPTHK
ncbi:hypothetical protein DFQ29_007244 [Apophysomyces sp. BC1021]|nr:hypothetical protein DFQ29_007244 [Apophysomyces sp. BC1021]